MEKATALVQNRHDWWQSPPGWTWRRSRAVEATRTQATLERQLRANYEHALAVYVRRGGAGFSVATARCKKYLPAIPAGVPSDVLERRRTCAARSG